MASRPGVQPSHMLEALEHAVLDSGRWKKWLQPDEASLTFQDLSEERRLWLVRTGARYIWTEQSVLAARERLYENLSAVLPDPNAYVVERIVKSIDHYVNSFNLFDANHLLDASSTDEGAAA